MIDRVHRELTDEDIARLADTYSAWRGDRLRSPSGRVGVEGGRCRDIPSFCRSRTTDQIAQHAHVLTPGR